MVPCSGDGVVVIWGDDDMHTESYQQKLVVVVVVVAVQANIRKNPPLSQPAWPNDKSFVLRFPYKACQQVGFHGSIRCLQNPVLKCIWILEVYAINEGK